MMITTQLQVVEASSSEASSSETSSSETSSSEASTPTGDLSACPDPVVIQTDWFLSLNMELCMSSLAMVTIQLTQRI